MKVNIPSYFSFWHTSLIIILCLGCGSSPRTQYLTVILPCAEDTTGLNERIEHLRSTGREPVFLKQDTEYVHNFISKPLIYGFYQYDQIDTCYDLSNSDSAIVVIELKQGADLYETTDSIRGILKKTERNLPQNLQQMPILIRSHIRNNKDQGVHWARGNALKELEDYYYKKDPDYFFRKYGWIPSN